VNASPCRRRTVSARLTLDPVRPSSTPRRQCWVAVWEFDDVPLVGGDQLAGRILGGSVLRKQTAQLCLDAVDHDLNSTDLLYGGIDGRRVLNGHRGSVVGNLVFRNGCAPRATVLEVGQPNGILRVHVGLCDGWGVCGKALIAFDTTWLVDIDCRSGPLLVGFAVYPNDWPRSGGAFWPIGRPPMRMGMATQPLSR
jgi:hypothetical protein